MSGNNIRWGWLKFMYIYTAVGAGGYGLGMILAPNLITTIFRMPDRDPVVFGVTGSLYVTFGLLSLLALRSPLKFVPVLLMQLSYKSIWLVAVFLPLLLAGKVQMYGVLYAVVFVTYVIGDLIAIPFSHVFGKQPDQSEKIQAFGSG